MPAYVRAADSLREAFDCAVIIVHHCGLDGTRPRGHTSLTGAADAQLSVSRDKAGDIFMTAECMKDGAESERIVSRLEQVEVGIDDDGEPITSCVVSPSDISGTRMKANVPPSAKMALDALNEAVAESGELAAGGGIPRNSDGSACPVEGGLRSKNDRRQREAGQQIQGVCPSFETLASTQYHWCLERPRLGHRTSGTSSDMSPCLPRRNHGRTRTPP